MLHLNIAIVQPRISYYVGGGEKTTFSHIKLLLNLGHKVILYTTKSTTPSFWYKDLTAETNANLVVKEFEVPDQYKYLYDEKAGESRTRWDIECMFFNELIYDQIKTDSPDILLNYYILDGIFKPHGIKNVLYMLGYSNSESEVRESFMSFYDATISISNIVKNKWEKYLNKKATNLVLNVGTDLPKITEKLNLDSKYTNIVFAGRLIERKGIHTLLEAFAMALNTNNNLKLHILGDGPLKEDIVKIIDNKKLNNKVVVYGLVENPHNYFSAADFCVFPSYEKEGLMGVVLEAMACEKAVITTTENGNEDIIINGENGILISPKDSEALCKAILDLAANKSKCVELGVRAKKSIIENNLWEDHAKKLNDILINLVSN